MDSAQEQIEYSGIDYRKYLRAILKYWYFIALSVVVSVTIGYIYSKFIPRQYAATCNIVIGEDQNAANANDVSFGRYNFNQVNSNKEIGIIRSKNLAEQTLNDLNFEVSYYLLIKSRWIKRSRYGNVPIRIPAEEVQLNVDKEYYIKVLNKDSVLIAPEGFNEEATYVRYGEAFTKGSVQFTVQRTYTSDSPEFFGSEYLVKFNRKYALVNEYVRNLSVLEHPTSQNILTLNLKGDNEEKLIIYLNTLSKKYVDNDIVVRNRTAENTIKYIDGQLSIVGEKLREAEMRLIAFKKQRNVYDNNITKEYSEGLQTIQERKEENVLAIESLKKFRVILDSFALGKRNEIIPSYMLQTSEGLGINELNKLIVERQFLLRNQNSNTPEAIKNNQMIEIQLDLLRKIVVKKIRFLEEQQIVIEKELSNLEGGLVEVSSYERELAKLNREFEFANNIYNTFQTKRIEAVLAKASTVSNMRVLDPARIETVTKIKPDFANIRKISLLIGLLLPIGIIVLLVTITDTIGSVKEVQSRLSIPVVGKLYHNRSGIYLVAEKYPSAAITESLRSLLARLEQLCRESKSRVISFTSGSSGEGKTFSALNLSILLAKGGKSTLLIGLDLRRPQLHKILTNENKIGLSTFLARKNKYEEVISTTHIDNLSIVHSGPIPPNPVELIQSTRLDEFIAKARTQYDNIIIDTPPLGIVTDAMLINRCADISLFVVRLNHTRKGIINFIKEQAASNTLKKLHLVVNDISNPERYGTYYNKYGGYYNKYGGYYTDEGKKRRKKKAEKEKGTT